MEVSHSKGNGSSESGRKLSETLDMDFDLSKALVDNAYFIQMITRIFVDVVKFVQYYLCCSR